MKKQFLWGCVAAVAASATFPTWADTHTVASGETETLSNVTEASRFVKATRLEATFPTQTTSSP